MPRVGGIVAAIVAVLVLILVLSAVHLLPQLRNPFAETTTVRSQPVILKSITNLSRYEAASGSFQVVVDLTKRSSIIPSFLEGSETLFIGQGTDIAFVDFATLTGAAMRTQNAFVQGVLQSARNANDTLARMNHPNEGVARSRTASPRDMVTGECKDAFAQVLNSGFPGGLLSVDQTVQAMNKACYKG